VVVFVVNAVEIVVAVLVLVVNDVTVVIVAQEVARLPNSAGDAPERLITETKKSNL
jgi:hypothetical protein